MNELAKTAPMHEVAEKGSAVYARIKANFEPAENGRYLAIEPDAEKTYIGNSGVEALEKAQAENPEKFFYLVKIGFSSVDTLAETILGHQ